MLKSSPLTVTVSNTVLLAMLVSKSWLLTVALSVAVAGPLRATAEMFSVAVCPASSRPTANVMVLLATVLPPCDWLIVN